MRLSLRTAALAVLRRVNPGDIRIKHHYTGDRLLLHAFRHRGYWYHGKRREHDSMSLFARLIAPGDAVVEIGAHIGYISLYFAHLAGEAGRVVVFEPGVNNLPYLRENLAAASNTQIIEKAAGNINGQASFFLEDLTGQNNSLVRDYEIFQNNATRSRWSGGYSEVTVDVVRLDDYLPAHDVQPDFIKIDVEGAELEVLEGLTGILERAQPLLMVEVTRNHAALCSLLANYGYELFNAALEPQRDPAAIHLNVFCFHRQAHREQLRSLGISAAA